MIREIIVSNFRSLGPDIHLTLSRLVVFVGPNGSGKSNTLDILSFVRDAIRLGLPAAIIHRGGIGNVRRRSAGRPFDIKIELRLDLDSGGAVYSFVVTGDKREAYKVKQEKATVIHDGVVHQYHRDGAAWTAPSGLAPRMDDQSLALTALGGDTRFKALADALSSMTVYAIFPDALRGPQHFDPARPMRSHGENWVSVLREMIRTDAKSELLLALGKLTRDIEDVRVVSPAGYLVAEFKQKSTVSRRKRWFEAGTQSDGTLRVAGLLTALLQSPPIFVTGVEEPELTVHPGAIPLLYDYLNQASETSQVMITTHSPIVLDVVDIDKDTIFVVERREGMTEIRKAKDDQLKAVRDRLLSLGELFLSGDLQLSLFDSPGGM